MPDPMIRRLQCAATLYFETLPDGLSLARLVVDVEVPELSGVALPPGPNQDSDRGDAWEGEDVGPVPFPGPRPVLLSVSGLPSSLRAEVA